MMIVMQNMNFEEFCFKLVLIFNKPLKTVVLPRVYHHATDLI